MHRLQTGQKPVESQLRSYLRPVVSIVHIIIIIITHLYSTLSSEDAETLATQED